MDATFYCDESGNTGTDWANRDQPVFVHGGWLVLDEEAPAVRAEMDRLRGHHRLHGTDLKWRHIARKSDPAAVFRDFFRVAMDHRCMPFFLVADKEFMIAAKTVETYFDPAYNHHLHLGFAAAFDVKKELVEALLGADDVLGSFAEMLRAGQEPTPEEVRRVAVAVAARLTDQGYQQAAGTLADLTDKGVRSIQDEFAAEPWLRSTTGHTFWAVMQYLEQFLRQMGVSTDIVHDNIVRFDRLLDLVRGRFRESDGNDFTVINDKILFHTMPTVGALTLGDSKDEPFIQFADLLCGFLRTVFTKLKVGQPLTPAEVETVRDLAVIQMEFHTWDTNVPERVLRDFARAAFQST